MVNNPTPENEMKKKRKFLYDAVSVYLVHKENSVWKVLLGYNAHYNGWLPIGGKKKMNETPDDTARREVREELGIEIDFLEYKDPRPGNEGQLAMPFVPTTQPKGKGERFYDQAYLCAPRSLDFTVNDELSSVKFFDEDVNASLWMLNFYDAFDFYAWTFSKLPIANSLMRESNSGPYDRF